MICCGLQSNVFDLLVNVRLFRIVLSADLENMFFSLKVTSEPGCFQMILYRFHPKDSIEIYKCQQLSFGLKRLIFLL